MDSDHFSFDLDLAQWAFTLALGIPVGLAISGGWMALRAKDAHTRLAGVMLALAGGCGFLLVALLPVDRLPLNHLPLMLKPYLSRASVAFALDAAFALGVLAGLAPAVGIALWRRRQRRSPWLSAAVQLALVSMLAVGAVAWARTSATPGRHPSGTLTDSTVGATAMVEDASMVTGLAVGPSGQLVFVELEGGRLRIEGTGLSESVDLHLDERSQAFHVVLHPDWPDQPYAYVSAEEVVGERNALQVLLVPTDGSEPARPLLTGLPIGQRALGNHYGSALVFCGDSFFVTTGDTDEVFARPQLAIRAQSQSLASEAGKVLRYRLDGLELRPHGAFGEGSAIFALGFRNPFAIACDEDLRLPVVADNGLHSNDQVRMVAAGSNHEWPFSDRRDLLSEPLFDSGNLTIAPTGVAVRSGAAGKEVVLSGFKSGGVYVLSVDADGLASGPPRLLHEFEYGVVGLTVDERGCIYVADPFTIWRLDEPGCM